MDRSRVRLTGIALAAAALLAGLATAVLPLPHPLLPPGRLRRRS